MRVLITRPRDEAEALAARLRAMGVESAVEPLLEIVLRREAILDLDGVQAILLTSANGARALAQANGRRDLKVLAVGEATAQAARAAGFAEVSAAEGTVATLADAAKAALDPEGPPLVHVSGGAVAGDLSGDLREAGFSVERVVLYDAMPAAALSPETRAELAGEGLDAVLFFSPRTASTFVRLAEAAGLAGRTARLDALCLSEAVARAAASLTWRQLRVAARPDQDSMIRLLRQD